MPFNIGHPTIPLTLNFPIVKDFCSNPSRPRVSEEAVPAKAMPQGSDCRCPLAQRHDLWEHPVEALQHHPNASAPFAAKPLIQSKGVKENKIRIKTHVMRKTLGCTGQHWGNENQTWQIPRNDKHKSRVDKSFVMISLFLVRQIFRYKRVDKSKDCIVLSIPASYFKSSKQLLSSWCQYPAQVEVLLDSNALLPSGCRSEPSAVDLQTLHLDGLDVWTA